MAGSDARKPRLKASITLQMVCEDLVYYRERIEAGDTDHAREGLYNLVEVLQGYHEAGFGIVSVNELNRILSG